MKNWLNKKETDYNKTDYYPNRTNVTMVFLLISFGLVIVGTISILFDFIKGADGLIIGGTILGLASVFVFAFSSQKTTIIIEEVTNKTSEGEKYTGYKVIKPKDIDEHYETLDDAFLCASGEDPTKDWDDEK